jgi:hypothetical protein
MLWRRNWRFNNPIHCLPVFRSLGLFLPNTAWLSEPRHDCAWQSFVACYLGVVTRERAALSTMKARTLDEARAAKAAAATLFGSLASVIGVGITRIGDGYGLKINLREDPKTILPADVAGVPVQVEVVGTIQKR